MADGLYLPSFFLDLALTKRNAPTAAETKIRRPKTPSKGPSQSQKLTGSSSFSVLGASGVVEVYIKKG